MGINFNVKLDLQVWFSTHFVFCEIFEGLILFLHRFFLQTYQFTKFAKLNPCKNDTFKVRDFYIHKNFETQNFDISDFEPNKVEIKYCSR